MKHMFNYENLHCYQLAVQVNQWLARARFPAGRSHLRDQALRACDSVVLNLAEGMGRLPGSKARANHLRIAIGSAGECCSTLDLVAISQGKAHQQKLRRIAAMLAGLR